MKRMLWESGQRSAINIKLTQLNDVSLPIVVLNLMQGCPLNWVTAYWSIAADE